MISKEDMEKTLPYVQEINILYSTEWLPAHETQNELISLIEKFFKDRNLSIAHLGYGVRPLRRTLWS